MTTTIKKLGSIRDVFAMRPHVFGPLSEFAEQLLRSPGALSQGERELIAALTSSYNDCAFCYESHAAVADFLNGEGSTAKAIYQLDTLQASDRLHAFHALVVASWSLKAIPEFVHDFLTDDEIHDAVSVIAAFNLFNRLVKFYGIEAASPEANKAIGAHLATEGYLPR
jgi:uncharacterized peroxidase-related enzyme